MFPQYVGPYRVEGPISGAHRTCVGHHRDSGRQVVIKCYQGVLSEAEQRAVSSVAGSLQHKDPSVVPLEEIFLGPDATYLVAPRVIGHDLASVLRAVCHQRRVTRAQLHIDATLTLMIEACVAFGAVAERRDHTDHPFSPADLFVTPDGRLKLTDPRWHYLDGLLPGGSHSMVGDLAYQLPDDESATAESARAFSIATLTWELLTGYRLFRREDPIEALRATRQRSIPNASGINGSIPEALSAALNQVLAFPASSTLLSLCAELRRSAPDVLDRSTVSSWVAVLFANSAGDTEPQSGDRATLDPVPHGETMDWVQSEPHITVTDLPSELQSPSESGLAWLGEEPSASVPPALPLSLRPEPTETKTRKTVASWAAPFVLITTTLTLAILWATARREQLMEQQAETNSRENAALVELAAQPVMLEPSARADIPEMLAEQPDEPNDPTVLTLEDLTAVIEGEPPTEQDELPAADQDSEASRQKPPASDAYSGSVADRTPEAAAPTGRVVILAPASATVLVDGEVVGTGHLERALTAGSHVITVTGPGLAGTPTTVRVQPGRTAVVAFE